MSSLRNISKNNLLPFLYIVLFLLVGRLIPHPPNFTPILAVAILAPYIFNNRFLSFSMTIIAMFLSDLIIGLHSGILWIYLAILICSFVSEFLMKFGRFSFRLGLMTIVSSLLFFLITNFSVWLIYDYYPKTFEGLLLCYTMGIPFVKNTILSTMIYTGIFVLVIKSLEKSNIGLNFKTS